MTGGNPVKAGTLSEVLAIGRVYESGKLMAASGKLIDKKSEVKCAEFKISTCEITKVSCVNFYYSIFYVSGGNICIRI